MKLLGPSEVSHMGDFCRRKESAMMLLALKLNDRSKKSLLFAERHAFVARRIIALPFGICVVLRPCGWPQIVPSIIGRIAIDVIDLAWGSSGHVNERQSMLQIVRSFNSRQPVAGCVCPPGFAAGTASASGSVYEIVKIPRLWVISQKTTQLRLCWQRFWGIHEMGRPSAYTRLAIKNPLSGQTLSGFATLPQMAV